MMTRLIFSLLLTTVLIASLSLSKVLAHDHDSDSQAIDKSGKTAESVREKLKVEKEARKTALEQFKLAEKEQNSSRELTAIQDLANKLIAERQKALAQAKTKAAEVKCVGAKTDISTAIDAIITNLTKQKADIPVATTVEAVKTIIKDGIIGQNHVFVAVMPALRGMCASDSIVALIDGRLAIVITKLKAAGLDTTTFEKSLAEAKTNAQTAYNAYKAIANNPGSATFKTDLEGAKTKLKAAKASLSQAKGEAEKLRDQLKSAPTSGDSTPKTNN